VKFFDKKHPDFFKKEFWKFPSAGKKCAEVFGDYIEK